MDKQTITSQVTNGRLEEWKGRALKTLIGKHEGHSIMITVERYYPTISGKQNRFLHGVFLPALFNARKAAGEEITQEKNREEFKDKFGPHEPTRDDEGGWHYTAKSVATWTTKETEDAMEWCRAHYADWVELPFPDPDYHNDDQPTNHGE